jgi:hypothetical protein
MSLGLPPQAFFGYPYRPASRRATMHDAAQLLTESGEVDARTWEDLSVTGNLIIGEITSAIDRATVAVFDVTDLNENVFFELGYAIGRDKVVWLVSDRTIDQKNRRWDKFGLLRTVGQSRYSNSDDVLEAFLHDRPHLRSQTILGQLTESGLSSRPEDSVLYLAGPHDTNGERAIRRALERERSSTFTLAVDDPREAGLQPLGWYAESISRARGVVAHFISPNRQDADVHNPRVALLSGLAVGLGKQVLILAEEEYQTPIDYQDMLHVYGVSKEASARTNAWLREKHSVLAGPLPERASKALESARVLRTLRLGSHVAEDEIDSLIDYFVDTRAYIDVLDGGTRLLVGRKGTGKTAILIRAAEELGQDPRNIVCTIKPPGYEIDGLLRLLRSYRDKDTKGYVIESIWKFLLYSELARATVEHIRGRQVILTPDSPEAELVEFVEQHSELLLGEFAVRLERAVDDLLPVDVDTGVATGRIAISEALHETLLRDLRKHLVAALADRHRVAILVDNLDKTWERDGDIPVLTQFLLGLLAAMRPIAADFRPPRGARQPVVVSLAAFLRSDIFWHLTRQTREPDKLAVSKLDWSDRELLLRVLEERYAAVQGVAGDTLWTKLFTADVDGHPAKDWLLDVVLPRPRDLVFLANAAITNAVNRQHATVEASDLRDARLAYSSYAIDSVLVEGEQDFSWLENAIYEFAGAPSVLEAPDVLDRIARARPRRRTTPTNEEALVLLLQFSFLGVETGTTGPTFVDNTQDLIRANALALARVGEGDLKYHIHPAFRPFLEAGD